MTRRLPYDVSLVAQDYGPRTPWVLWACTTDDFDQREPLGAEP